MEHQLSARALYSSDTYKYKSSFSFPITVTSSKPLRFSKKTRQPNSRISTSKTGSLESGHKTQKLNLEVSPHRAVSAVRLMRIELGGAFADLLNEKGKGSGDNEMGYVERTLGFRTRDLDDRDLRLVSSLFLSLSLYIHTTHMHTYSICLLPILMMKAFDILSEESLMYQLRIRLCLLLSSMKLK